MLSYNKFVYFFETFLCNSNHSVLQVPSMHGPGTPAGPPADANTLATTHALDQLQRSNTTLKQNLIDAEQRAVATANWAEDMRQQLGTTFCILCTFSTLI